MSAFEPEADVDYTQPVPDAFGRPQGLPRAKFAAQIEFDEYVEHVFSLMQPPWLDADRLVKPKRLRDVLTERSYLRDGWRDAFRSAETSPTGFTLTDRSILDAVDAKVRESHRKAGPLE